jgi:hypothetical protein
VGLGLGAPCTQDKERGAKQSGTDPAAVQ